MTIATLITDGFGSFGDVARIVTLGLEIGEAVIVAPVVDTGGGGDDYYYYPKKKKKPVKVAKKIIDRQRVKVAIKRELDAKPLETKLTREQEAAILERAMQRQQMDYDAAYMALFQSIRAEYVAAEIASLLGQKNTELSAAQSERMIALENEQYAKQSLQEAINLRAAKIKAASILLLM